MPRLHRRRTSGSIALVTALALLVLAPVTSGHAADGDPTVPSTSQAESDAALEEVRTELAETSEAMLRAAADLRLADRALPGARSTAVHARRALVAAQTRQALTARERGSAQVQLLLSTEQAEATAAAVTAARARLGQLARSVYQGAGSLGTMSVLLEARSPADLAERLASLQTVASSQQSTLTTLETAEDAYGARAADLETLRDRMAAADEQAQRDLRDVEVLEAQASAAQAKVKVLVSTRAAAVAAAAAAQAADDAAARRRAGETDRLQGQLAGQVRDVLGGAGATEGSTVPPRPGTLAWPVQGRLSSPFGMRVHPVTGVYKLHTGQDIAVACGTPIRTALPGTVVQAGWNSAYGWRTVVSHGTVGGVLLTTTYNHQTAIGVNVGDPLVGGQTIGTVGSTGYSTGCHLHFELYVNSTLVDPLGWLPAP